MPRVDDIAAELAVLHRGRGIETPELLDRVGPALRRVLFDDQAPDASVVRHRLRTLLVGAAAELPPDERRLVLEAFAVAPSADRFEERVSTIASRVDRAERTVKRRLTAAETKLAQVIVLRTPTTDDDNPYAQRGWYVEEMESHAYLSDPRPQFYALRTIRATQPLAEVTDAFTIPDGIGPDDVVQMHGLEGCADLSVERETLHTWRYRITLPETLATGATHRLGLRIVLPHAHNLLPWNAIVAVRETKAFTAVVHHVPDDALAAAWRHDGVPSAVMQDGEAVGVPLVIEPDEPLRAHWPRVRRGLAYGIAWRHET